ncbi:MAG TPA: hypothetical protein VFC03_03785 [Acidimicrobiales bacterium]|nr:hypothetical protein [Acidimicrobiales bacterium]
MATILFSGPVLANTLRVIDLGAGQVPRVIVEQQQPADAMGGHGWSPMDPIPRATLEALLLAAHVIT